MLRQAKASSSRCCWGVSSRALAWGRAYARVARVWYVSRSRTMFCWGSFCAGPMFCWGSAFFLPGAMHVYCQPNPKPGRHPPIGSGPSGCQARPPKLASGASGNPGLPAWDDPVAPFLGFFSSSSAAPARRLSVRPAHRPWSAATTALRTTPDHPVPLNL